ncbi:MAG: Chemotaxis protein methyltransferase CheR [Myxococcales bacterium]|nr:Chemotaxis protein methyltransferase CheR [Myxococcales bacterium]
MEREVDALAALDHVFRQAPIPLLVIDAATDVVAHANDAWKEAAGHADPAGRPATELLPSAAMREVGRVLETREVTSLEGVVLGDVQRRAVFQPILDGNGTLIHVLVVYEDSADRVASQRKDHFIVRAAHELRAPLSTVLLWQQLLRRHTLDAADRDKAFQAIEHSATSMSQMLGNLVDMARAVSGDFRLDLEMVDVDALVAKVAERARRRVESHQLELVLEIDPGLGAIRANGHRLEQVLDILIGNGVRHTPSPGTITVRARRDGDEVELAVRDTGYGIKRELLADVFQPFSYVDDVTARGDGSLGLGLALAHEIVTVFGGTLTAASEGVGTGATFTCRLP